MSTKNKIQNALIDLDDIKKDADIQSAYDRLEKLASSKDDNVAYEVAYSLCKVFTDQNISGRDLVKSDLRNDLFNNKDTDEIANLTDEYGYVASHPEIKFFHTNDIYTPVSRRDLIQSVDRTERLILKDFREHEALTA